MIRLSTFQSDVTPPMGHPLCAGWYPPAHAVEDPLFASGLILVEEGEAPIVLCALDWAELSNGDYDRWREELAAAVGTDADRVLESRLHLLPRFDGPPSRGTDRSRPFEETFRVGRVHRTEGIHRRR